MRPRLIFIFVLLFSLSLACGSSSRSTELTVDERVIVEMPTVTNTPLPPDTPTPLSIDTPVSQPPDTPTPLPAPTDTPVPEQINPVEEVKAVVASGENDVNLRGGPSLDFPVVGILPAGQTLEIIGRTDDSSWWQVSTPNGVAWIATSITTASNTDANLPIVDAPPNQATEPSTGSQENEQAQAQQPPPAEEPAPVSDGSLIIVTLKRMQNILTLRM